MFTIKIFYNSNEITSYSSDIVPGIGDVISTKDLKFYKVLYRIFYKNSPSIIHVVVKPKY